MRTIEVLWLAYLLGLCCMKHSVCAENCMVIACSFVCFCCPFHVHAQGAAVISIPRYGDGEVFMGTKVQIEVRIGPEREPYVSEPAEFTYLPQKGMDCFVYL